MTACVEDLQGLPDWPGMLSASQAACYFGVSEHTFLSLVAKGHLPKAQPWPIRRRLWARVEIDAAIARKSGNSAETRMRDWQRRYKDRPPER